MAARRVRAYLCKPQYHSNNSNGCPAIPENWTLGHTNNPFGFPSYTGNNAIDPGFYNMEINGSTPVVGDGFWVTINAFGQNSFDPNYGVNSNSTSGITFGTVTYPSNACSNPIVSGVFNQGDPDYPNWISRVRFKVISVEPLIVDPNNGDILQQQGGAVADYISYERDPYPCHWTTINTNPPTDDGLKTEDSDIITIISNPRDNDDPFISVGKTIQGINLDLSDLPAAGENRTITITGDDNAEFILEIKNEDNHYYNFTTNSFSAIKTNLQGVITGGGYKNNIKFPTVTDDDQYDITLSAKAGSKHATYSEVRFPDGTLDINSSTGSNSLVLNKVIYQYTILTLTISNYSPNGTVSLTNTSDTLTVARGKSKAKTAFTISCSSASTESFRIIKQPTIDDILSFLTLEVGGAPELLPGENQYPAVSDTDTVNGAVTSGTTVTMDTAVASKVKVGDRVTGNAALNAITATVTALTGTYTFTLSEAVAIADGITLSFSNQKNYQWPVDNVNKVTPGMIVVPGTNVTANTTVSKYEDITTIFPDTVDEKKIIKNEAPAINTKGLKPTVSKGLVTVQAGNLVFNNQQALALAGDTLKVGGYGITQFLNVDGYQIKLTDLKIALTPITTITTSASSASTSVALTARDGILNTVSTVSGIGINPALAAPTVNSGANATGAGTVVLSAAQTLEDGITLTFSGAGKVATITGNIEIVKAGTADATLRFDVEKLLSTSA